MNEIKKLSELDEEQVNQSVNVFVEGFYNVFSSISKDKEKLHNLFKNSFDYNMTYAYLQDGESVGFLGLANYEKRPLKLNKEIFMGVIGGFAGKVSYKAMCAAMEKLNVVNPQDIYIDYIATSPKHRSKGIGKRFIEFIHSTLGYKHIELEVFSKNPKAKNFYEREGFKVVKVKKDLMMVIQGFGRRIVMRLEIE
ncbi:MAG: GNAT family N-acetyltransferase [Chitinispirillales bacterium]|nr:GNAT family N-acetyltransferase [Chitinispirillales bacterium]